MAFPVLPSPSNFLAVALVINRSRDGPRFVFHYPPHVQPANYPKKKSKGEETFDLDEEDDLFLDQPFRPGLDRTASLGTNPPDVSQWNSDDHLVTESGTQVVPWEHVAGFPTKDLENILTPARAYHKKLFHVSLDPLRCVSYPVYVPENGTWKKKRKQQKQKQQQQQQQSDSKNPKTDDDDAAPATDIEGPTTGSGNRRDSDAADHANAKETAKAAARTADDTEDKKSSMTMFNLVFILNPEKHEAKDLVDLMFFHIIKKINKAYKYCQQRSDFVWKESKKILALKDKGREESKYEHCRRERQTHFTERG